MTKDREKERCFYLRFVYAHAIFLASKGLFIDIKQKKGGQNPVE